MFDGMINKDKHMQREGWVRNPGGCRALHMKAMPTVVSTNAGNG